MPRKKKQPTPVQLRGRDLQAGDMKKFMSEWSLSQAEDNHVETIEEANDFEIHDEEDEDFFNQLTVYEMHEAAEDNLALLEQAQLTETESESHETGDQGEPPQQAHDQSAPVEPNSIPESNAQTG